MPHFQGPDVPLMIAATIDCADLETMTTFWGELLGVEVAGIEEPFGFLRHAPDRKVTLWLQRVPEEKRGKNRVHLDFAVPDLDAAERRVIALGGSLGDRHEWHGNVWRVCHDPEGNVFDIMEAPESAVGEAG